MKFRERTLSTGSKVLLGRDSKNNDELVKSFKGKKNVILHTAAPGSPFCVIETKDGGRPSKKEIEEAGAICARYSQDWRDHKHDIAMHVFTGHDVKKRFWMKQGSWNIKNSKTINIKKAKIKEIERHLKDNQK